MNQSNPGETIYFLKRVNDGKLHFGEAEDFYFMQKYDPKDQIDIEYFKSKGKPITTQLIKGRVRKVHMYITTFDDDTVY